MNEYDGRAPVLLPVSGPPASSKTPLARRLAADFGLPVIHKDAIEESLFDTLGVHSPEGVPGAGLDLENLRGSVWQPLRVSGPTVIAQTDDDAIDYAPTYQAVREALGAVHE